MQTKNQRNSEGNRDGYWESEYFKGNFINGKPDGEWKIYHFNKNLWCKGHNKNGKRIGYWEIYNRDGSLRERLFYAN